jgi:hypothetical protein
VFVIAVDDDVPAAVVDSARSLLHWFTLALIDIRCCSFDEDRASGEFVQSLSGDFGKSRVFTIVDAFPIFFSLPEDDGIPASTFSAFWSNAFPLNVTASSPNFARKSLASSRLRGVLFECGECAFANIVMDADVDNERGYDME